jgi:1,4-dihydroxy-2-naphthoyl-CoA synthase
MSDDSNVRSMFGGPSVTREANSAAVEVLEDALERARSGEIVGVGIVMADHDGRACFSLGGLIGGFADLGAAYTMARAIQEADDE